MMKWRNTTEKYGLISIGLHWLIALAVPGLFVLGLWMSQLSIFSSLYRSAIHWHKSLGAVFLLVILLRLAWRLFSPQPHALSSHPAWQKKLAQGTQWLMYVLLLVLPLSGYLLATSGGRPVAVFNWFELPALVTLQGQAEIAGAIHNYSAWALIVLAVMHALAAFKHHLLDRDGTLRRML